MSKSIAIVTEASTGFDRELARLLVKEPDVRWLVNNAGFAKLLPQRAMMRLWLIQQRMKERGNDKWES